ncbi:MAG: hypothetical protein DWQ37_15100 [Planctomycetota bacterium]|nr:MAG: hypothetical protein DWQ37_15100 [Planctomycetota bacterium]
MPEGSLARLLERSLVLRERSRRASIRIDAAYRRWVEIFEELNQDDGERPATCLTPEAPANVAHPVR